MNMRKLRLSKLESEMAYARLLRAVYHRARLDLIESTITSNTGRFIEVTKFYRNDPYIFTPEEGDDAIETILHDVNEADGFILTFIESFKKKEIIPNAIDKDSIFYLLKYKYPTIGMKAGAGDTPIVYWRNKHGRIKQ